MISFPKTNVTLVSQNWNELSSIIFEERGKSQHSSKSWDEKRTPECGHICSAQCAHRAQSTSRKHARCSHLLTSLISKWPEHRVIIFYPTSQRNTGEITSLMSSFHIGVISTSIALGPHINLLQEETDWSLVHSNERKRVPCTFIERIYSRFLFLTSGVKQSISRHIAPPSHVSQSN